MIMCNTKAIIFIIWYPHILQGNNAFVGFHLLHCFCNLFKLKFRNGSLLGEGLRERYHMSRCSDKSYIICCIYRTVKISSLLQYCRKGFSVEAIMKATIGCFLCVFLLSKMALSENNSNGFIKNGTKGQQEGAEELSGLMLEQILDECRRLRQEVTSLRISQAELEENQRASMKRIMDLEHQNLLSRQEFSKLLKLVDKRAKYYQNESLEQNLISKRLMLNTESGMPMTPQIAFSAILSNHIVNPYQNERIVFGSTVTNSGNGYNKNNGLFVTPVKGVYVFFATIVTLTGKYTESQIVRNGNNIGNIFSAGTTTYGTGSIMTVTNLELGDAVWVRVAGPLHDRGTVDEGFTQFSGFLLFETF